MDALTKRLVWSNIQRKMAEGKTSVILTSHSMEECEVIRVFFNKDVHWNQIVPIYSNGICFSFTRFCAQG